MCDSVFIRTFLPLACLAVLALVIGVLLRDPSAVDGSAMQPGEATDAGDPQAVDAAGEEVGMRTEAARADASPLEEAQHLPSWSGPPDRDHDLHGIVIGPNGERIPGAEVTVRQALERGSLIPNADKRRRYPIVAEVQTSATGEFRARVRPGGIYDLDARHEGLVARRISDRCAGEYVEIRLDGAALIHGRVLESGTEVPIPDVRVMLSQPDGHDWIAEGLTGADGRYRIEGIAPGEWRLFVVPPEHESPPLHEVQIAPGAEVEQDFALHPGTSIHGRVVEEGTLRPVLGAEISDAWTFLRSIRADADGRFEARGLRLGEEWTMLHVRAPGFGHRHFDARALDLGRELELPLSRSYSVTGSLLRADGSAAAGAFVVIFGSRPSRGVASSSSRDATADADGAFTVTELPSDIPLMLFATRDGDARLWRLLEPPARGGGTLNLGVLIFHPAGSVSGRVTAPSDEVPDATLELRGPKPDSGEPTSRPSSDLVNRILTLHQPVDDLGRFHFGDLAAGSYELLVRVEGAPPHVQTLQLSAGEQLELDPIVLEEGMVLTGKVVNQTGEPIRGATVFINPLGQRGNLGQLRVVTDAAGRFKFLRLADGELRFTVDPPRAELGEPAFLPVQERIVSAGTRDLLVSLRHAGWIDGEVVSGATMSAATCEILAFDGDGLQLAAAYADGGGRFRILAPTGGSVRLEFWPMKLMPGGEARGIRVRATSSPAVELASVPEGASGLRVSLP